MTAFPYILLAAFLVVVIVSNHIFTYHWLQPSAFKNAAVKISTIVCFVLFVAAALEIAFCDVYVFPDSKTNSIGGRRWLQRHWKPTNSLGYRDSEPNFGDVNIKHTIVLGDEFAAGLGIESIEERFASLLQKGLSKTSRVATIAQPGWATEDALQAYEKLGVGGKVVILAYRLGDIEKVAARHNLTFIDLASVRRQQPNWWIRHSYFLSFLYHHFTQPFSLVENEPYQQFLTKAYKNSEIWNEQSDLFRNMHGSVTRRGAKLVAIILPPLNAPAASEEMANKVAKFLTSMDIPTIDLAPYFKGFYVEDLHVHSRDPLPSRRVHKEVADLLIPLVKKLEE